MSMIRALAVALILFSVRATADTLLLDEGVTKGPINIINCVGVDIVCTRAANVGTMTVTKKTKKPPKKPDAWARR